jgi:hypothetical protein
MLFPPRFHRQANINHGLSRALGSQREGKSVIELAGTFQGRAAFQGTTSTAQRTLPSKAQSFASELTGELGETKSGDQKSARPAPSPPTGQTIVSWRDPAEPKSPEQPSGLNGLVISYPGTTSGAIAEGKGSSQPPVSFDDAYWAKQPAAVQQLRNIQDPVQKTELATQLAQQGYSIDVPIMVWGWDPQIATEIRQSDGYTWVPSALQQPVEVAPGLTVAGLPTYDPAHPPAGSIPV